MVDDPLILILTPEIADAVRGPSDLTEAAALHPQPLTDGRFFLGASVLDATAHSEHAELLATCPQVPFSTVVSLLPPEATSDET
jgi:hypothetical protein